MPQDIIAIIGDVDNIYWLHTGMVGNNLLNMSSSSLAIYDEIEAISLLSTTVWPQGTD